MFGEDGSRSSKSDYGHAADLNKIIDEMRVKTNKIKLGQDFYARRNG